MTALERFNEMREQGSEVYFDTDEIIELLEYFDDKDDREGYTQALELGLRLHPEDVEIQTMECRLYMYDKEYDKALQMITSLRNHADAEAMILNAMELECLYATDRADEATAILRALPANEDTEAIYEALAAILVEMDRNEEALLVVNLGLELFPENVTLKEERCYHTERQKRWQEAAEQCEELIDLDPYSGDYWFMHGRIMIKLGEYDRAIHSLEFAQTCDEDDIEAKLLRTFLLYFTHNYEKAVEAYFELIADERFVNEQLRSFTEKYDLSYDDLEKASQEFYRLFGSLQDLAKTLVGTSSAAEATEAFDLDLKKQIEYIVGKLILEARAIRKGGREWDAELLEDLRFLRFGDLERSDPGNSPEGNHLFDDILNHKFYQN